MTTENEALHQDPVTDDTFAGMSDEDFLNQAPSFAASTEPEEPAGAAQAGDEGAEDDAEDLEKDPSEENPDDKTADAGTGEPGEEDEPADPDADAVADPAAAEDPDVVTDPEAPDNKTKPEEKPGEKPAEVNYQAEYEKLLRPFKANGKEIKVDNVEEAIQLMQMGANYNKKMTALKPNLKLLKLLENNELLSEEKLSYLIDLEKKNPEAIRKLVKDSGIDPLDIDTQKESEYKPEIQSVDDRQLELDAVLDDIQDTPTYSKTIGVVSQQWDKASKQAVADDPQLLYVINDHMANGVYDRISSEIEKQRMLGRLNGLSDIAAYQQIGDELNAKGAFIDLFQTQEQTPAEPAPVKRTVVQKPKVEDPKLKDKKRAASSTRTAPSKTGIDPNFNPLAISDEEFEKLINQKLM